MVEQLDGLIPRYERAGVRLMLAGHEHNFQHGRAPWRCTTSWPGRAPNSTPDGPHDGPKHKSTRGPPSRTACSSRLNRDRLIVTPYGPPGPDGEPVPLLAEGPDGDIGPAGFVITPDG